MTAFRGLLTAWLLLAGPASAETLPFRSIEAASAAALERRLAPAGAEGYRLLAAGFTTTLTGRPRFVTLLERSTDGPFEYAVLGAPGELDDTLLSGVNARAESGFRLVGFVARPVDDWWLPDEAYEDQLVLILQRSPVYRAQRYSTLVVKGEKTLYRELAERREQGFVVAGLVQSGRRLRVLLEQSLEAFPETAAARPFRLLSRAKKHDLKQRLRRAGREGYEVLAAADPTINAPPFILLERGERSREYGVVHEPLRKLRNGKLARKLNKKAREGFRVVPRAITRRVLVLERTGGDGAPAHYRVLSSRMPGGLSSALGQAADAGYGFVAMFAEPDVTRVLLVRD